MKENFKKLSDDKMMLRSVQEMMFIADAVPLYCAYKSLETWKSSVEKQVMTNYGRTYKFRPLSLKEKRQHIIDRLR